MQRLRHETKTPLIRKLGADINMKYTNISRKTIHQMIKYIKVKLSNIEKDTRQIRKEHLIKLTYNYSKENKVTQQIAINKLLEQYDIRQTFKTLKNILKPV